MTEQRFKCLAAVFMPMLPPIIFQEPTHTLNSYFPHNHVHNLFLRFVHIISQLLAGFTVTGLIEFTMPEVRRVWFRRGGGGGGGYKRRAAQLIPMLQAPKPVALA